MPAVRFSSEVKLLAAQHGPGTWLMIFGAPWVGPMREMELIADAISAEMRPRLRIGLVSVDACPAGSVEMMQRTGQRGLPLLVLLRAGEIRGVHLGSIGRKALVKWIAEKSGRGSVSRAALPRTSGGS